MSQFSYLTSNLTQTPKPEIFSPYDTLENFNFQAQKIISLVEKFTLPQPSPSSLINQIRQEIFKLLHLWQETLEPTPYSQLNPELFSSFSQKQREKDENEDVYLNTQFKSLQEQLKKSEESRQRVHSYHQDCLRVLNQEIDEIVHDFKQKFKKAEKIENILEELFTKEELEQERQVALGKGRRSVEIKITKIEEGEGEGENWDMGLESEESSGPPGDLQGSAMLMYNRLHELKEKLQKFRHNDLDCLDKKENSLEQALGSLPITMKSVSSCQSVNFDQMLNSLEASNDKPKIFEFQHELLTLDEKENFIMTLIEKEGTNGKDVCLEDILSVENSEQKAKAADTSLSFLDCSGKVCAKEEIVIEQKPLGDSKPDLDIRLSPISTPKDKKKNLIENLSQESSIVMGDNNTSSFISENSFLNDDRKRVKGLKRSEKNVLRRPKIAEYEDSNSGIFPPINTSSDDQSFRMPESKIVRRLPLVPCKPICAPPQERLNIRGRSLLPIQISVGNSPKIVLPVADPMNLSASPNTVNKLRMRRYKEMTRPFVKILNKKLVPREPIL